MDKETEEFWAKRPLGEQTLEERLLTLKKALFNVRDEILQALSIDVICKALLRLIESICKVVTGNE